MATRKVVLLLALAAVLRLLTQAWDSGLGSPHPDERMVAMTTERLQGWFADPEFYAYGSLHFQAVRWTGRLLGLGTGYGASLAAGRALSLVASLLALLGGTWLALRAWGRRAAALVLLLGAWAPLDLQQSHYATVEAHHALWVMATLLAAFCFARRPRALTVVLAGAAGGAALAVKVTSLGLIAPLAAAVLIAAGPRLRQLASWSLMLLAAGLAAFWLGQPWAFTDGRPPLAAIVAAALAAAAGHRRRRLGAALTAAFAVVAIGLVALSLRPLVASAGHRLPGVAEALAPPLGASYLRGVGEQVAMVSGRADLPYVRVYADTVAVLYPLRELTAWGLGPALVAMVLLAAVAAGLVFARRWRRWLAGRWSSGSVLLVVLLAWLGPMALRLATLEVKFLRYWQPLLVPAVMLAAWGLSRAPRRLRRPLTVATVAATVLWGASYLAAFLEPHPHRTAAAWLMPLLAEDDVVAFENWDETLGLRLPEGGSPETVQLPSYDLPDSERKAAAWCETLASADWVVLTSHRVRRTVLTAESRFPLTARLYRLLLSGEAGFAPLARVDRAPRLLGLELPVQLADESFVNYDFPRVVVLRRTGTVDPGALAERVRRPLPFLDQLDFRAVESSFIDPLPAVLAAPGAVRQVFDATLWLGLLAVLGASAWILLLPALRGAPDAGVGLALASGWIGHTWLLWLASELGLVAVSPATATVLVLVLVGAAAVVARRRGAEVVALWRRRRRGIVTVLAVALAVGALFLAVRAFNPAIHWGEKPMDFTFLNAFVHAEAWPPDEPWMAGAELHYYYFGAALAAAPTLVVGCTPAVAYNLAAATVPMLAAAVLSGFGLGLVRGRRWGALLPPLLVLVTGNLAWPWLLPTLTERAASWTDLARWRWFDTWWATSRVVPGFAIDEYPLWTALFADLHGHFVALPVLLATLAWGLRAITLSGRHWRSAAAAAGVGAAVLAATNPWDLLVLTLALGCGAVAAARRPLRSLARLTVAAGASLVAALPFLLELAGGLRAGAGGGRLVFLNAADFAPSWAILRHFGVFLAPLAVLAVTRLGRDLRIAAPLAAAGIAVGLSLGSTASALALALAALFLVTTGPAPDQTQRLTWTLAGLAMIGVAICEHVTLVDRMNTLFKVYNGLWVLLAVALAMALATARGWRRRLLLGVWLPLEAVALVNLPLGVVQGVLQPRMRSPRPTLDGQAFLEQADPSSWWLVRALQGSAAAGDVVAEAAGDAYGPFTRLAMHTGQPTVVGWPWHLQQRGQSRLEIDARYDDLETLYGGADPAARRRVLDRFRVRWVALGTLERTAYDLTGDEPMVAVPGLVRIARHGPTALYLVQPISGDVPCPQVRATVDELAAGPPAQLLTPPCPSPFAPPRGSRRPPLAEPRGLAASPEGWFVVADSFAHRIGWYRDDGSCLDSWSGPGGGLGTLREPSGVALADDGRLAIADTWNGRVLVRHPDDRVETVGTNLYGPRDLMWSEDGSLLVADTGNRRLLRFSPPAWPEQVVARFETPVVGLAWSSDLVAVALPEAGEVSLLDPVSGRVVRRLEMPGWSERLPQEGYLLDLGAGGLLASAPRPGELWRLDPSGTAPARRVASGLAGVTGLAALADGLILASLTPEHRLVRVALGERASEAVAQ